MSFSTDTKAELASLHVKRDCCRHALLLGMLRSAGVFSVQEISLTTHSTDTVFLCETLLLELYGIDVSPEETGTAADGAGVEYRIAIRDTYARQLTGEFSLNSSSIGTFPVCCTCESCRQHFLRGVFLSCGSVSDPHTGYRLDLMLNDDDLAEEVSHTLDIMGIPARHAARKGMPTLYYKDCTSVADALGAIGATRAYFSVLNTQIEKEVRNNSNRRSNCEIANIGKTVGAAGTEYEAIKYLEHSGKLGELSDDLQETAKLRLEHPELSLRELASLHVVPLTKSGMNHRLKRIVAFSEKLQAEETKQE